MAAAAGSPENRVDVYVDGNSGSGMVTRRSTQMSNQPRSNASTPPEMSILLRSKPSSNGKTSEIITRPGKNASINFLSSQNSGKMQKANGQQNPNIEAKIVNIQNYQLNMSKALANKLKSCNLTEPVKFHLIGGGMRVFCQSGYFTVLCQALHHYVDNDKFLTALPSSRVVADVKRSVEAPGRRTELLHHQLLQH